MPKKSKSDLVESKYDKTFYRLTAKMWGHRQPLIVQHQINGKTASLRELHVFLKDIGINVAEPRFVVFQNGVSSILDAPSGKLHRMLCDASGTTTLLDSMSDSLKKIKTWQSMQTEIAEKMQGLENALRVDQKKYQDSMRIRHLEDQINLASELLREFDINEQRNKYKQCKNRMDDLTNSVKCKRNEQEEHAAKLKEIADEQQRYKTELEGTESEYRSAMEVSRELKMVFSAAVSEMDAVREEEQQKVKDRADLERCVNEAEQKVIELRTDEAAASEDVAASLMLHRKQKQKQDDGKDVAESQRMQKQAAASRVEVVRLSSILQSKKAKRRDFYSETETEKMKSNSKLEVSISGPSRIRATISNLRNSIDVLTMRNTGQSNEYNRVCEGDLGQFGDHMHLNLANSGSSIDIEPDFLMNIIDTMDIASHSAINRCVVARTSAVASTILDQWKRGMRYRGWRVWTLDRLQPDTASVNRVQKLIGEAQIRIGSGKIVSPLSIMKKMLGLNSNVTSRFESAYQLAFGSYAVAIDDIVASRVCLEYGIVCWSASTKTKHEKGQIVYGGSSTDKSKNTAVARYGRLRVKYELDKAVHEVGSLNCILDRINDLELMDREIETAETELASAKQIMEMASRNLKDVTDTMALGDSDGDGGVSESLKACMEREAQLHKARTAAEASLSEAQLALEAHMRECERERECEVTATSTTNTDTLTDPNPNPDPQRRMDELQHVTARINDLTTHRSSLQSMLACLKNEEVKVNGKIKEKRKELAALETTIKELELEMEQSDFDLDSDFDFESEEKGTSTTTYVDEGHGHGSMNVNVNMIANQAERDDLFLKCERWKAEYGDLAKVQKRNSAIEDDEDVTHKNQSDHQIQQVALDKGFRELYTLQERSSKIHHSSRLLEQGVSGSRQAINKLELITYNAIRKRFKKLFNDLVPTKHADIVCDGENDGDDGEIGMSDSDSESKGARRRRKTNPKMSPRIIDIDIDDDGGGGCSGIHFEINGSVDGVGKLSGGEKILMSVAFLLAIATSNTEATYSYPSLPSFFIFDEIDAALDESNGQKLGLMLSKINSQVIAISHRAGFEKHAARVIRLYKNHNTGSTINE